MPFLSAFRRALQTCHGPVTQTRPFARLVAISRLRSPAVLCAYGVSNALGRRGYAKHDCRDRAEARQSGFAPAAIVHAPAAPARRPGLVAGARRGNADTRLSGFVRPPEPRGCARRNRVCARSVRSARWSFRCRREGKSSRACGTATEGRTKSPSKRSLAGGQALPLDPVYVGQGWGIDRAGPPGAMAPGRGCPSSCTPAGRASAVRLNQSVLGIERRRPGSPRGCFTLAQKSVSANAGRTG